MVWDRMGESDALRERCIGSVAALTPRYSDIPPFDFQIAWSTATSEMLCEKTRIISLAALLKASLKLASESPTHSAKDAVKVDSPMSGLPTSSSADWEICLKCPRDSPRDDLSIRAPECAYDPQSEL